MKNHIVVNEWAREQWQDSELGDERRNKRAIKLAISLLNNPNSSLPTQTENWAALKASYRLLSRPDLSHEKLQGQHWENTMKKASKTDVVVLFVQEV